ncbi:MAG: DNA polymerase III subunit alpha [Comamonadaceae bacterium]|nr:MAG: DNA polymerase III subunit alpha [Comamonadaceae bacterium]
MPEREERLQGRPTPVARLPRRPSLPPGLQSPGAAQPGHEADAVAGRSRRPVPAYAELHCLTNFSFQRGASHPDELVERACELGYEALAITDECSVSGVVRAHAALEQQLASIEEQDRAEPGCSTSRPRLRLLLGAEFGFGGFGLVALARDLAGWGGLCEFITAARMAAPKGEYTVSLQHSDFTLLRGCEVLFVPDRAVCDAMAIGPLCERLAEVGELLGAVPWLVVELFNELDDDLWLAALQQAGARTGARLVAAGGVHMHVRSRKPLQDVITAVREGRTVADCGFALQCNAERHLRSRLRLGMIYPAELLANTLAVADRCRFRLTEIAYDYPQESVLPGLSAAQTLRRLTLEGFRKRYPAGTPEEIVSRIVRQIRKELRLIAFKKYEMYFLTVHDIVRFAREQRILCQGRGSAANSAVCYCLFITEVDPGIGNLLFERFISKERNEPPDIDVDFEHQRREEVIQYIYAKYGRERAAIAAVVVRYRSRMAIRDVGKALGVPAALVDAFARDHYWFDKDILAQSLAEAIERAGVGAPEALLAQWLELTGELRDFPRHLSQHVGGFVLTNSRLTSLVPVENASMKDRSIIQWEKDDLEAVGLMKVDVLALGMLSAIRRAIDFRNAWRGGQPWGMQQIPREDPQVYDMICTADTVGVFQIESRAQMSMLPRLKPRQFYDLVVEVAIVRPGPIQGGMVHPYLKARKRRDAGEDIEYVKAELAPALGRTLGVPIFQEQVMQLAMVAARFSADQADALRRSMAAWSRKGGVHRFRDPLVKGMTDNGYPLDFAEGIFKQIEGFGEYGFPESHAASFALLVYVSCWLKCHEPACFLAAMLDAQPMGFYSPSQLVQDARRHGVVVRPVDVTLSGYDSTLEAREPEPDPRETVCWPGTAVPQPHRLAQPAVRMGLRCIASLSTAGAMRLLAAREQAPFTSTQDLALRAELHAGDMAALAAADALRALAGHRRQQVWEATAQRAGPALLKGVPILEPALELPEAGEGEQIVGDYAAMGLTLRRHPLELLRPRMARLRLLTAQQLRPLQHGQLVRGCGIVTMRQRPPTAKGTMFVTLEDETGIVNVIVWKDLVEAQREPLLKARLLAVYGVWQRDVESGGEVRHLLARGFKDLTPWLGRLGEGRGSRDFH